MFFDYNCIFINWLRSNQTDKWNILQKINDFNVEIGKTSKNSLINKYGPPSFESPFNKNIIYYISQNTIYKNLNAPQVKKMILYKVNLDKNNIVKEFEQYDEKNIEKIEIAEDAVGQNDNKLMLIIKEMIGLLLYNMFSSGVSAWR